MVNTSPIGTGTMSPAVGWALPPSGLTKRASTPGAIASRAASAISPEGAARPFSSLNRVPKPLDMRSQDRDHRLQVPAIMPVAEARAVVQPFRYLSVAGRPGIALIFVKP